MTVTTGEAGSHHAEADVALHNPDLVRPLIVSNVTVEPETGVHLVAVRLVNASGPFNHALVGQPQLGAPVSIAADAIQTIRFRFVVTGTCRQALTADPSVAITSHYSGQPTATTVATPRGTAPGRGWVLTAVPNCRKF
jgi:hypothetical protein